MDRLGGEKRENLEKSDFFQGECGMTTMFEGLGIQESNSYPSVRREVFPRCCYVGMLPQNGCVSVFFSSF